MQIPPKDILISNNTACDIPKNERDEPTHKIIVTPTQVYITHVNTYGNGYKWRDVCVAVSHHYAKDVSGLIPSYIIVYG
jgi:hypothetical protein